VFQSRTRFWKEEGISPNITVGSANLMVVWAMAEEVRTHRGLLVGTGSAGAKTARALDAFRKAYPGSKEDIEQALVWDWSRDPWASACETIALRPGELPKIWPHVTRPCGRVYFAGAYCDSLNRGQESATRSALRVAEDITVR
jgi:monoamine oxidase